MSAFEISEATTTHATTKCNFTKNCTGIGAKWKILAECDDIPNQRLYETMLSYLSLISTLSGLICGFTYLVLSEPAPDYGNDTFAAGTTRTNGQAGLTIAAFLTSLFSVLTGSMLFVHVSLGGVGHIRPFMIKMPGYLEVPTGALATSIFFMLFASVVHIGGLYDWRLYYPAVSAGAVLVIGMGYMYFQLQKDQRQFLDTLRKDGYGTRMASRDDDDAGADADDNKQDSDE